MANINFTKGMQPTENETPTFKFDDKLYGQVNFDNFLEVLNKYQNEAIDYLYDIEPQSNNLFWAGYFEQGRNIRAFFNAHFRIRKITIPFPTMTIDNHKELRYPVFKDSTFSQEVKIDWFEDVYHSVQKYHLDWFSRWYNREYDVLRCGVNGKFRTMKVVAYHYVDNGNSIISAPQPVPIMAFDIGGLVPISIGDSLTFSHDSDDNDKLLSVTYKCGRILWNYSKEIGAGKNVSGSLFETNIKNHGKEFDNALWSPEPDSSRQVNESAKTQDEDTSKNGQSKQGNTQKDEPNNRSKETSPENVRAYRSLTSHMISEGSLG